MARGPLRKIIGYRDMPLGTSTGKIHSDFKATHEVLECGHVRLPRQDIIGETNASRRRCRACADGEPAHVELVP